MILSLPYKIWNYLYVIVFSFNFFGQNDFYHLTFHLWVSLPVRCWLVRHRELNPVFNIQPASLHLSTSVLKPYTEVIVENPFPGLRVFFVLSRLLLPLFFSAVSITGFTMDAVIALLPSYSFLELRSFPCSPDWDFPPLLWALLLPASTVVCDDREKPFFVLVFQCLLFLDQLLKDAFLHRAILIHFQGVNTLFHTFLAFVAVEGKAAVILVCFSL